MAHDLLTTQKNEILALISGSGLDPAEFSWGHAAFPSTKTAVPVLRHVPSGAWFKFGWQERGGGKHAVIYRPGKEQLEEYHASVVWSNSAALVTHWLRNVKREYEAPDLWAELSKRKELVAGTSGVVNTPFTPEEQIEIQGTIEEAKAYARTALALPEAQQAELEAELDYLADASTRVGRLDWRNALLGALIGKMIDTALPQSAVQQVMHLILRGVAHMYGELEMPALPTHVG